MRIGKSIHPGLIVHWTGKDIEKKFGNIWTEEERSQTSESKDLEDEYIERFVNILRYGLWMTLEPQVTIDFGQERKKCEVPSVARICFTELRLSQTRSHAKRYGRLGIGVKRPFLFDRGGRPVVYYGHKNAIKKDLFFINCAKDLQNKSLLHFFKPMNSESKKYDFYEESEWRILFSDELLKKGTVTHPKKAENNTTCQYLVPLDGWLSAIVYPSVSIKNKCCQDKRIRKEIARIKECNSHANRVEGGNWPVELDLDMCNNF